MLENKYERPEVIRIPLIPAINTTVCLLLCISVNHERDGKCRIEGSGGGRTKAINKVKNATKRMDVAFFTPFSGRGMSKE